MPNNTKNITLNTTNQPSAAIVNTTYKVGTPGVSGAIGPTGPIGPVGPTFHKLSDIGVVIVNTPEYCEFFKNLPAWVFDYQQLHQTIEQLNSKLIVQTDKAYVNFVNCFVRSPVYSFDNFDVLYQCDMASVKKL